MVIIIEAIINPITNFGKRVQISRASGLLLKNRLSHLVIETNAMIKHQIPINMSRPTTFISVNVLIACSLIAAAAAIPGASANSDVPIQAPAGPGKIFKVLIAKGKMNIIRIDQSITSEIAIETCCFSAFTALPIAIEAETPQIEPPAANVAAKRLSSEKTRVAVQ